MRYFRWVFEKYNLNLSSRILGRLHFDIEAYYAILYIRNVIYSFIFKKNN